MDTAQVPPRLVTGDDLFEMGDIGPCELIDGAFISHARLPEGLPSGFLDVPPELVIEVISLNDRWQDLREKLEEYYRGLA